MNEASWLLEVETDMSECLLLAEPTLVKDDEDSAEVLDTNEELWLPQLMTDINDLWLWFEVKLLVHDEHPEYDEMSSLDDEEDLQVDEPENEQAENDELSSLDESEESQLEESGYIWGADSVAFAKYLPIDVESSSPSFKSWSKNVEHIVS